jgi:hypothetical protein
MRSRGDRHSFITKAAGVPAVLAMISAGFSFAGPALAQGVTLLKVDVAVLAKGLRASKLIGAGVVNNKKEKIGTLDEIVISDDGKTNPVARRQQGRAAEADRVQIHELINSVRSPALSRGGSDGPQAR